VKKCPFCREVLVETAIRCRYCRTLLVPKEPSTFQVYLSERFGEMLALRRFFYQEPPFPLGVIMASFFWVLAYAMSWFIEYSEIPLHWLEVLRNKFFVFIKEPLLQDYVYVFIHSLLLKIAVVLAVVLILTLKGKNAWRTLSLHITPGNEWRKFIFCFLIGSLGLGWFQGLDPLIPSLPAPLFFKESAWVGNVISIFSISVVAPVTEEIFFRGLMYPVLQEKLGKLAGIVITAFLFALVHYPQSHNQWGYLSIIFIVGGVITLARALTGSTRFAIQLHLLYNTAILGAGFLHYGIYGY